MVASDIGALRAGSRTEDTPAKQPPGETLRPSPELCRLLNAALIDPQFGADLQAHPVQAALGAALTPGEVFGCRLPDPALQLPPISLSPDDWSILQGIPPSRSIAELWSRVTEASARQGNRSLPPSAQDQREAGRRLVRRSPQLPAEPEFPPYIATEA